MLDDGNVQCWGDNLFGELDLGDARNRGDDPNELEAGGTVDLGAGLWAIAVAAGDLHTCAILNDGGLKCWDYNQNGQLGYGDAEPRGDAPDQMGDALPRVEIT